MVLKSQKQADKGDSRTPSDPLSRPTPVTDQRKRKKRRRHTSNNDNNNDGDNESFNDDDDDDDDEDDGVDDDACVRLLQEVSQTGKAGAPPAKRRRKSDELATGLFPPRLNNRVHKSPKIQGDAKEWTRLNDRRMKYLRFLGLLRPPQYGGMARTRSQVARSDDGKQQLKNPLDDLSSSTHQRKQRRRTKPLKKEHHETRNNLIDGKNKHSKNEDDDDDERSHESKNFHDAISELKRRKKLYHEQINIKKGIFDWSFGEGDVILVADDALVPPSSSLNSASNRNDLAFRLDFLSRQDNFKFALSTYSSELTPIFQLDSALHSTYSFLFFLKRLCLQSCHHHKIHLIIADQSLLSESVGSSNFVGARLKILKSHADAVIFFPHNTKVQRHFLQTISSGSSYQAS